MRYKFLVTSITIYLIILSGCQPQNSVTPSEKQISAAAPSAAVETNPGSHDGSASSKNTKSNQKNQQLSHPHTKTSTPSKPGQPPVKRDHVKEDQFRIDQALELCNLAQAMWEEGNLEEAISYLDNAYELLLEIGTSSSFQVAQQKEDIRFLISKRILEIYASRQIVVKGQHNEIPITLNDHVKREIKRLTGPEKRFFIYSLERASRYRPYILEELKKAGLPQELSWLPLIESGFKIRALSSARALGLWQFIPSTGYKFGLQRTYYVDERMDPEKATRAAIAYFKELHNLFGDWATVLAAYNCGEGRVLRTIRRQKINYLDNFWDLYQNLPRETARYVPRFIATLHIVNNLSKYDIKIKNPQEPIPYRIFEIKKQLLLKDVAREIGVKTKTLKDLNPELRYGLLPPETYRLRIPEPQAELFATRLDKIKSTYSPPPMFVRHRIRRGDTLSGIARRYRTSVKAIARANNISSRSYRIIAGKTLKVPTGNRRLPSSTTTAVANPGNGKPVYYKVRQGDNLWIIAKRFSTTTKQLMRMNSLNSTRLKIGQRLIVRQGQAKTASAGKGVYRVKSGDSPFLIAKKHNMSLNRLLVLNRLTKTSKIYPGQKLIVE
ncbi:MAG: LysM peptidoglycan-binding domain-containing protein [Desulfobacterales bacterium]|nr:LysM peptidoglycan-binding domain-containing protein [Desulfobacterales bacterium]